MSDRLRMQYGPTNGFALRRDGSGYVIQNDKRVEFARRQHMSPIGVLLIVLILLWALGVLAVPATGSLIHVLLVIVLVIVVIRLVQGQKLF